ncbi:MAG: alanine--tRNA ligase [Bdellovibrionales bacterium]|nr:alanine--tRNA ligase [Bdellovibrionales bacterium]
MITSAEIREKFLAYFETKGHTRVASSSLNQTDDPTLLFPNAGMNQFKNCFLGTEKRDYTRAATSQKCMRISGKHNDFENVGVTARHHTFFEMLGNFSFGDYFKKEAIQFAWEFITKVIGIPEERIWITIFRDDDEAHNLWVSETGMSPEKIVRLGEKDNFWAMGDTGPCGPCSELHYVTLDDPSKATRKGLEQDDGSFIEIWNLVFMQFNRLADGTLEPLPKPSVDTGMGLERITAVVNALRATYETDLLRGVIRKCEELSGFTYDGTSYAVRDLRSDLNYARDVAMRVIADHSRAIAFLIADGIHPSSDGRGYVLRRILRRAVRHGRVLNFPKPFLRETTGVIIDLLGKVYPELQEHRATIVNVADAEEVRFYETLDSGLALLQKEVESLSPSTTIFPGKIAFQLYDTYGFPIDLTEDALKAYGLKVDSEEYQQCLEDQRRRSRDERKAKNISFQSISIDGPNTEFIGYTQLQSEGTLAQVFCEDSNWKALGEGSEVQLVFSRTPFYGESGGQVGDCGTATLPLNGSSLIITIDDTQKTPTGHFLHFGKILSGEIDRDCLGKTFQLAVDANKRNSTAIHHSATHLVHSALRTILGDHVKQAGSRVDDHSLRFDYSHFEPLTKEQLREVEQYVNHEIRNNYEVTIREMSLDEAKGKGAMALFGEKYGDRVRVVEIGPHSLELCGGTHVHRSGDLGFLTIASEGGISAGVRRIECFSGEPAERELYRIQSELERSAIALKSEPRNISQKIEKLLERQKELERELQTARTKLAQASSATLLDRAQMTPHGVRVIAEELPNIDSDGLKALVDSLRVGMGSGVVALGSTVEDKAIIVAGVTSDLTPKLHAGNIIKEAVKETGGKGGGRPDFAQAGGLTQAQLSSTLKRIIELVP